MQSIAPEPSLDVRDPAAMGPPTTAGRLNSFQDAMLAWDAVHPYNAVHAVILPGPVAPTTLRDAITCVSETMGIGRLSIESGAWSYRSMPAQEIPLRILPTAANAERALTDAMSNELNRPFPEGEHHPIRWVTFDDAEADRHALILAYHHVASDAYGIQMVLSMVLRRYLGIDLAEHDHRFRAVESTGRVGRRASPAIHRRFGPLIRAFPEYLRLRQAHRMNERKRSGEETHVALRRATRGNLLQALRCACEHHGTGPNAVFLAALAVAIARHTPERLSHPRRRKLALATVRSTRNQLRSHAPEPFGVRLAESVILVDDPDAGFDRVLAEVSGPIHRGRLADGAAAVDSSRFLWVKYLWPILGIPNTRASYRKLFPICAGVSMVVADESLFGPAVPRVLRYVRGCPPGPAMPMVLAPTFLAGDLELGLVYRQSCLTEEQADGLLGHVAEQVESFAQSGAS